MVAVITNKKRSLGSDTMRVSIEFPSDGTGSLRIAPAASGFSAATFAANEWPSRDITFYVPYAPGGSTDPISRK
jgi:hypothetical protein